MGYIIMAFLPPALSKSFHPPFLHTLPLSPFSPSLVFRSYTKKIPPVTATTTTIIIAAATTSCCYLYLLPASLKFLIDRYIN
ncbi:hypothetical protein P167DRAFT_181179 [Morchella conica CCBAS932]|uniref:Uncharacterized protein n=1 Tax=Morchella conica CCBAS932 TaxID=1392247 RepID=A0A3N4KMZ5_9PEZI|nr:hypothetical protein P167DRAFT_181179 [Morchella conica CCBAS932]